MTTTVTLLGCDGSEWELLDRSSPVRLTQGLGGLHLPVVTHRWATTHRRSGSRWKGSVTDSRTFTMNLAVGDADPPYRVGNAWRRLDGDFWKALSTEVPSTLVINGRRRLTFRLDSDNDFEFIKDPALAGRAQYPINCIADEPEWFGKAQEATFRVTAVELANYYGGETGVGPPFLIEVGSLTQRGRVANPGDLPSYPVWTIAGPASAAEVGVPGRTIRIPFTLGDGDQVIIDTGAQTITDPSGNNLWPKMGAAPVDFAPIPPGDSVEVIIGLEGPQAESSVKIELTTRYLRAWGDDPVDEVAPAPVVGVGTYPGLNVFPARTLFPIA